MGVPMPAEKLPPPKSSTAEHDENKQDECDRFATSQWIEDEHRQCMEDLNRQIASTTSCLGDLIKSQNISRPKNNQIKHSLHNVNKKIMNLAKKNLLDYQDVSNMSDCCDKQSDEKALLNMQYEQSSNTSQQNKNEQLNFDSVISDSLNATIKMYSTHNNLFEFIDLL